MTPKPGGRLELAAYFYDPAVGSWVLISAMEVERTNGWNGMYSFLEQWTGAEPEHKRWGLYGPAFAKPKGGRTWEQVSREPGTRRCTDINCVRVHETHAYADFI